MSSPLRLLADGVLSLVGIRTLEEPAFQRVAALAPDLEIRLYGARLAAETTVSGLAGWEARREGFRRLARYIFGANQGSRGIAMTAPVAAAVPGAEIAMTIPVAAGVADAGTLTMRFFLPAALTVATAPPPRDPRVRLVQHPACTIAALRYSASGSG